jgi:hypothetical protein
LSVSHPHLLRFEQLPVSTSGNGQAHFEHDPLFDLVAHARRLATESHGRSLGGRLATSERRLVYVGRRTILCDGRQRGNRRQ